MEELYRSVLVECHDESKIQPAVITATTNSNQLNLIKEVNNQVSASNNVNGVSQQQGLSFAQCAQILKEQLGIEAASPVAVIDQVAEMLTNDQMKTEYNEFSTILQKAQYLVKQFTE